MFINSVFLFLNSEQGNKVGVSKNAVKYNLDKETQSAYQTPVYMDFRTELYISSL